MFTTNTVQAGTVPTLQYQEHTQKSQGKNMDNVQQKTAQQTQQTQQEFPTFCYTTNVNMIGKINAGTATGAGGVTGGVNIAQLTTNDEKTCYIAQPFSYNYALVNQMQIAPNGIQNTISNISFKCDVCGLMFGHLTLLNAHKRIHAQDTDNNITVVATGVSTSNEVAMPPHIQILSSDPSEQQQHHVQLQDTKPILLDKVQKCITCGNVIPNNPKRKGPKLIRCENCIAQGPVEHRNNQMNTTQIFVAAEDNTKFEVSGVSGVQASVDPLSTTQNNQQQKPLPGHHPVKKRNLASVTKCQNCNGSGIIFVGGNKNKSNQQNSDKSYHCNICGGSFSRYSSLWSHKKLHSGEKNFKCGICGIAFAKAVYLKNHSRIHTGEKPYRCNTCGMQFSQSPHLKNHERTHSGEKPYVCEVCDKGFARHATLWNHRRIHTGEKPYKCETCGSAFSQAAHLKNHAKVHSGEKPFKCDICTAAFADRFALKRHRGIHDKYGQTAPLPAKIQQNQHEQQQQQNSQQTSGTSQQQTNTQPAVEVEHCPEQAL
ncbi:zinc finger protein 679-like isoform X1 [Colias croceus]|uniref:zinc finger protein 679-like isoform X1 n=1 Tax=Colias crocea TaxID=72248 RepID=UPI001E27D20F|nr:zinc finger protein 679-like isoform X1 [Colias croceus]XP_045510600.1 zinc finger protein 679-like isoform X1 [Colias croceus]